MVLLQSDSAVSAPSLFTGIWVQFHNPAPSSWASCSRHPLLPHLPFFLSQGCAGRCSGVWIVIYRAHHKAQSLEVDTAGYSRARPGPAHAGGSPGQRAVEAGKWYCTKSSPPGSIVSEAWGGEVPGRTESLETHTVRHTSERVLWMIRCLPKKENQMATSDLARDGVWCPQKDTAKSSPQNLRGP